MIACYDYDQSIFNMKANLTSHKYGFILTSGHNHDTSHGIPSCDG